MLETLINIAAVFGAFWFLLLAYIGFRVTVYAFTFASTVGIAQAKAGILGRASDEVRQKFLDEALKKEMGKTEGKPEPKK